MDCHTIVGNGAYFAPDLTKIYKKTGPAWLKAFLGSPGSYPTKTMVKMQLKQLKKNDQTNISSLKKYLSKFEGAQKRIKYRSGTESLMPNLSFSPQQINALIAFLKYSSKLNTEGWPPKVKAKKTVIQRKRRELEKRSGLSVATGTKAANTSTPTNNSGGQNSPPAVAKGKKVAMKLGCTACHSTNGSKIIGPTWKGLYNSTVKLNNGKSVEANNAYLKQSILHPDAKIVKGFHKGKMPSFEGNISDEQLSNVIAYIKSLK